MNDNLLDIHTIPVAGQAEYAGQPFPLVLACHTPNPHFTNVIDWISVHREMLNGQAAQHGAILFRGFPLKTAEDFDAFVAAFHFKNFPYEQSLSNAVRINRTERVFTANEAPSDVTIFLHHEMAQTPIFPSKLFFYCEKPAEQGGATPLCRSDILYERLQERCPEFVQTCEEKGLKYTNVMPPAMDASSGMGRSWQSTLRAENREQAENRLRELGYSWEWLTVDNFEGCLRATTPVLSAVRDLGDGRKSFFNQLIAAYQGWKDTRNDPSKAITFGDGQPLNPEHVFLAAEIAEEVTFDVPWEQGDVALVDNFVVMHGRRSFEGERKVLASLVAEECV